MKSSSITKSKSPKQNLSNITVRKPKKYLNKNLSKKYIYKKEKAADTDKILQNNKISKNIVFSPVYDKRNESPKSKLILNNSNNDDLRRGLEIRDDMNIDYDKYQQQSSYLNSPSITNYNHPNINSNLVDKSYNMMMNYKNGYMPNTNRINKWKCSQCGNVNSIFNYLCNNCNMPNTSSDQNNSILVNQRNNSTGKNLDAVSLDKNLINNSFNSNPINISSYNLFSHNVNNNIMKKQLLKKNFTNVNLTSNINNSSNNLLNPFYNNLGFNTIKNNKNNYFYNSPNIDINPNNSISSNNILDPERDSNIIHLYSYSNYLANELKSSNDTNLKLLENYQNNENEYNNNYKQNDIIKKKIKILKDKENQLDKINEQLKKGLSYIQEKNECENLDNNEGNYSIKSIIGLKSGDEFKTQINRITEENDKLTEKLKENKDTIINLKESIGILSDDKTNCNATKTNQEKNQIKNLKLKELKEKINKCCEEIEKQNQDYKTLDSQNKDLEQKLKLLKNQLNSDNKENINKNSNEIKSVKQIKYYPITINYDNENEKDKYMSKKEQNNQLTNFLNELNKINNNTSKNKNKNNILKKIYLNLNKNSLKEAINNEDNQNIIGIIETYMNLLNEGIE